MGKSKANERKSSAVQAAPTREEDTGGRKHVNVALPASLVERGRGLGLDVSHYCENILRNCIEALEGGDSLEDSQVAIGSNLLRNGWRSSRQSQNPVKGRTKDEIIEDFHDFCEVDLNLAETTINRHLVVIRDFLEYFDDLNGLTKQDVRGYLKDRKKDEAEATYANRIKALRKFLRDFLDTPCLIEGFELPSPKAKNYDIPDKSDLQKFYKHLPDEKYEAIFLFFATTGLRTGEVIGLKMSDVDFDERMVIPNHESTTKRSNVTFYNEETEEALESFLPTRNEKDERLFQTTDRPVQKSFERTSKLSGVKIKPKTLRKWFAREMRNQGVSGEHIDAFCGRVPNTVRGRHYTDFSQDRLEEVYDRAEIRVLD